MKISRLIILPLFALTLILTSGCAVTKRLTQLSDGTTTEDKTVTEEIEDSTADDMVYEDGFEDDIFEEEELLEEEADLTDRELPDILKDDPELIRLANETGALYTIYFDYDSYTINSDFMNAIKRNAHWMNSNPFTSIILEGHADERGSNEYNLALSQRRAMGIEKFLIDFGVNRQNLTVLSYGEEKPANQGNDEAAWRKNRRVEIKILK